ncbi:MAG: ankyrin repeat domain-containing protein [Gorillibacterium sp.]|nr:ankyrin repeat domain-containing protein [Gorillibacterium sp.]
MALLFVYFILFVALAMFGVNQASLEMIITGVVASLLVLMLMGMFKREARIAKHFTDWLQANTQLIYDDHMTTTYQELFIRPQTMLVSYKAVISLGIFTRTFTSRKLVAHTRKAAFYRLGYSLLSILLGWWSIPWGPIRTTQALADNIKGRNQLAVHDWLEYGAARPMVKGMTPLIKAVFLNQQDKVFKLLEISSSDIYEKDAEGRTALMRAAEIGNLEIFDFLLAKGADVHDRDKYGDTVLIRAAANGNEAIVSRVLKFRIDPNELNDDGESAWMCAASRDYRHIVKLLVEGGAYPELQLV